MTAETVTKRPDVPAASPGRGRFGTRMEGEPPGIPFGRLLRMESRKLVNTRAGRGLLIAIATVTVAVVGLTMWFTEGASITFSALLTAAITPQIFIIPAFGVIAATSEVAQRTGIVTYCVEPRRARVVLAKALAAAGFALLLSGVAALSAVLAHAVAIATKGAPGAWSIPWDVAAGAAASQLLAALQGVAFGLFFRSTALAITVFFLLPLTFTTATSLTTSMATARPWLDFAVAQLPLMDGEMTPARWGHLATSGLLWLALPFVFGILLLRRRDIT